MKVLIILFFGAINYFAIANTDLGTLNTIRNGFATIDECKSNLDNSNCNYGPLESLSEILDFTTTNQCIATKADFKNNKLNLPKCPNSEDQVKGLDNTYPSAGTFALYTGNNDNFIFDLAKNYLEGSKVGKFNLILPKSKIESLKKSNLIEILNSPQVNIIEVNTMPEVDRWMQDSFQFTSVNGKPALYQLEHFRERGSTLEQRLACELARKCNIPYYIPPDMVDPNNKDQNSLNSGGNLEVLPGGTFYTGIIKSEGFKRNIEEDQSIPFRTNFQEVQKKALEESGNTVLELDTSFLSVGHVDEMLNIVKTNRPSPCDYAVLIASPKKAFELMDESAKKIKEEKVNEKEENVNGDGQKADDQNPTSFILNKLFLPSAHAGIIIGSFASESRCDGHDYYSINEKGKNKIIEENQLKKIYELNCIDGEKIEDFVDSNEYQILKRQNIDQESPKNIASIMEQNKKDIINELKRTTKCESPVVIEIPVMYRNGLSYTPDLVNGVVETPPDSPSRMYLPKTYFKPFDNYVKDELSKYGVDVNFVHDLGYHLAQGEVHCGTNTARICK